MESPVHVDDELALDSAHKFQLLHDGFYRLFRHHPCFQHFFHGEWSSIFLDSEDFAKSSTANRVSVFEVRLLNQLTSGVSPGVSAGAEVLAGGCVAH